MDKEISNNELARFVQEGFHKIDERFEAQKEHTTKTITKAIEESEARTGALIEAVDAKVDLLSEAVTQNTKDIQALTKRVDRIDQRLASLEDRMSALEEKLSRYVECRDDDVSQALHELAVLRFAVQKHTGLNMDQMEREYDAAHAA